MHDRWKFEGEKYRLTKVSFPPPSAACQKARSTKRCSADITERQGTAEGKCDNPNEVLFKVFSKNLEYNTYAFEFLRNMQLTNEEVGIMLGQWAWNTTLNNGECIILSELVFLVFCFAL